MTPNKLNTLSTTFLFIRRRRYIELGRPAVHDVRRRPRRVGGRQLCREQRRSVVVQRVWRGEPQRAVQRHGARPGRAVDPMARIELLTQEHRYEDASGVLSVALDLTSHSIQR